MYTRKKNTNNPARNHWPQKWPGKPEGEQRHIPGEK